MLYFIQYPLYKLSISLFSIFLIFLGIYERISVCFENEPLEEYDYIIVGSGTAGSLIASSLERKTNYSFVVLEAGGNGHSLLNIPILAPLLQGSQYDWAYQIERVETACLAFKEQKCIWPRGKIAGGTSQFNNMIYVRGFLNQYVEWFGNKYSYDDIKMHFDEIEKHYFKIDSFSYTSELADCVIEACDILDIGKFVKPLVNQITGQRWSPISSFNPKHLFTHSFVERVLIRDRSAKGVTMRRFNKIYNIRARKGVILSAGVIESPKLLMLSGIGPEEQLKKLNIDVISDLPVGKHLRDHITTGMDIIVFNKTLNLNSNVFYNPVNIFNYFIKGIGPLTSPGCEVIGFKSFNSTNPELQFMMMPVGLASDLGAHLKNVLGVSETVWRNYYTQFLHKQTASFLPIVLQPKSEGEILLRNSDPKEPPVINANYLSHTDDVALLIKGIRIIERIAKSEPIARLGGSLNDVIFPGCESFQFSSDSYWECYIRHMSFTSFHPIGTCSLNKVVDSNFIVKNVNNLYVIDASVLPEQPLGNINAVIGLMASLFFESNFQRKIIPQYCKKYDNILGFYLSICFV